MARKKWKSAEEKQLAQKLAAEWEALKKKYEKPVAPPRGPERKPIMPVNPRIREIRELPSLDTGVTGAVTLGDEPKVYTGDKMIGVATMHKSNLVPIFSSEEATDVSTMRR